VYNKSTTEEVYVPQANAAEVANMLGEAIAEVRDCSLAEVRATAQNGEIEFDSKEAECAITFLEDKLDIGELAGAQDLRPEQMTTLSSLTDLVMSKMPTTTGRMEGANDS
jgi:hypothetical protein